MDKPEDHGGGDVNNPFCKYCTDEKGNLMPRDQVRAKMIQFHIQKQGKTQEEAEKLTDQLMGTMPAWKGEGAGAAAEPTAPKPAAEPTTPEPATPEPTVGAAVPEPTVSEPTKGAAVPGVTPEPSEPTTEPVAETTPEPTAETPAEPTKPESETPTE